MSFLARGLSNLIGIVVPIIASFKILKKPTNKRLIQVTQYWSVYGTFLITDWFLTTFFVSCFIPFYDFFVLMFTILMVIPQIGFASMLYIKFLAPLLRKYERRIDRISGKLVEKIWEKMPALAIGLPAAVGSILSTLNETPVALATLEIDETVADEPPMDTFRIFDSIERDTARAAQRLIMEARLNRSIEIQSEDDDDDVSFDYHPAREIKKEMPDVELEAPAPEPSVVRQSGMRTRRQTRARQNS